MPHIQFYRICGISLLLLLFSQPVMLSYVELAAHAYATLMRGLCDAHAAACYAVDHIGKDGDFTRVRHDHYATALLMGEAL